MKKVLSIILALTMLCAPLNVCADVRRVGAAYHSSASVSTGYYVLVPRCSTTKALTIRNFSKSALATTCSTTYSANSGQIFYIKKGISGTYIIKNKNSGLILSVKGSSTADYAVVRQNTWQQANSQRWYITRQGSYYRIQSSISKNFLTVNGSSKANGASVIMRSYHKYMTGQMWKLVRVGSSSASPTTTPSKYKTSSRTGMTSNDYKILNNIIGAVETGGQVYGQRDYGDYTPPYSCSSLEVTCTLGWGAFYGDEAQYLISQIQKEDPAAFKACDKKGLIAAALTKNWVKTKWCPNEEEKAVLKALIVTTTGKRIQDEMFASLMETYVASCKSLYTSNTWAIMMYCEIRHLGGANGAARIFNKVKTKGSYTLDNIMWALQQDQADTSSSNQIGDTKFWSRHEKCCEFIQKYAA